MESPTSCWPASCIIPALPASEYMKPIWNNLAAMHLNTVIGTVSWELLEPEEGKFDFALVDAQIGKRRRGICTWY